VSADLGDVPGIVARPAASAIEFREAGEGVVLGALSWSGGKLSWSWRRVGTRSFGKTVDLLADALSLAEIEVRLEDGSATALSGPVPQKTVAVALGGEAAVPVAVPRGTSPAVVMLISAPWRKAAPADGAARCESDAGTVGAAWDPDGSQCRVSWTCDEVAELEGARKALSEREAEAKRRPEAEREFIVQEILGLRARVEELTRAVERRQSAPQPVPPIEVRGRGGRVLGRIQVVLTPRKSQ
jgi:hypothetical protein